MPGKMERKGNMTPGASAKGSVGNPMGGKNIKETPTRPHSRDRNGVPYAG